LACPRENELPGINTEIVEFKNLSLRQHAALFCNRNTEANPAGQHRKAKAPKQLRDVHNIVIIRGAICLDRFFRKR
jgi:hypothetical protein